MISSSTSSPRTIQAHIHEKALSRVTRMFSSGLGDIFNETLQNARRAGASPRAHIVRLPEGRSRARNHHHLRTTATASKTLPSCSPTARTAGTPASSQREDAAGMGFLSLAQTGAAPSPHGRAPPTAAPSPAGRSELDPEHFAGETARNGPFPTTKRPGPTVPSSGSPPTTTSPPSASLRKPPPATIRCASSSTACPTHPPKGQLLERRDFLREAVRIETWRGLRIGVFKDRRHYLRDPNLNFHGLTLHLDLPYLSFAHFDRVERHASTSAIAPTFSSSCPRARRVVETPFLADLHRAALHAIFRAMAADPAPMPCFKDWLQRLREAGIDIKPPPAELRPWRPDIARLPQPPLSTTGTAVPATPDSLADGRSTWSRRTPRRSGAPSGELGSVSERDPRFRLPARGLRLVRPPRPHRRRPLRGTIARRQTHVEILAVGSFADRRQVLTSHRRPRTAPDDPAIP